MMQEVGVILTFEDRASGRVAILTVSNPERLNALNSVVIESFESALRTLSGDDEVRVVVLQGAGDRSFIGGADINELATLDPDSAESFITGVHRVCEGLRTLPVPVIAKIRGYCLGAGLEVAASCDLRVATEESQFGMPEVQLGVPSVVEAALLPRLVGWGRTRELVFAGKSFMAREVEVWGLLERVAPAAGIDAACNEWVESILRAGPRAVRLQKELIREWERLPIAEAITAGISAFRRAYETDEPATRMKRFLDRGTRGNPG